MKKYISHKLVQATKIAAIEFMEDGSAHIAQTVDVDIISTTPGYRTKFHGDDKDLGYFVRYADGYQSWSPTKAFEEGYTEMTGEYWRPEGEREDQVADWLRERGYTVTKNT